MVDYVKIAATAKRLVEANGRQITFIRPDETPDDPAKPWLGSTGADTSTLLYGVFVPPNTVRQFGLTALGEGTDFKGLVSISEQIAIVFPETEDLREYTHLLDGTVRWGIIGIQVLRPGATQILAFVGVRR